MLTQEDWNIVLFAGMERTSHWAALYFVALMTFGNYVLFNLLVAILVEGFSNQVSYYKSIFSSPYCTYEKQTNKQFVNKWHESFFFNLGILKTTVKVM